MGVERSEQEADLKAAVLEFMQFKYPQARLQKLMKCPNGRNSALTVYGDIESSGPSDLFDLLKNYCESKSLLQRKENCITLIRQAFREATAGGKELSSLFVPKPDQHRARHGKLMPVTVSGMREWAN